MFTLVCVQSLNRFFHDGLTGEFCGHGWSPLGLGRGRTAGGSKFNLLKVTHNAFGFVNIAD